MKRIRNPRKTINGVETRRRWSNAEIKILAQWIANNKRNSEVKGLTNIKETTISYIRRMFMETSLYEDSMTDDSMRSQYKKIVTTYKQTREWINNTPGVEDNQSFNVLARCPYFFILDRGQATLQDSNSVEEEDGNNSELEESEDQKDTTLNIQIDIPDDDFDLNSFKDPLMEGIQETQGNSGSTIASEPEKTKIKMSRENFLRSLSKSKPKKALPFYEVVKENSVEKMIHEQAMAKIREDSAIEMKKLEMKSQLELQNLKAEYQLKEKAMELANMKEIRILELESQEKMLKLTEESKRESDKKFVILLEKLIEIKK